MADLDEKQVTDELDFDFGAKKKKKKKKDEGEKVEEKAEATTEVAPDEAPAEVAPKEVTSEPVDDLLDASFGDMKKKKKKKPVAEDLNLDEGPSKAEKPEEVEEKVEEKLGEKKKKKKMDLEAFENELAADDDFEGQKADDTSASKGGEDDSVDFVAAAPVTEDPWAGSDRDYTYKEILDRAFRIIRQANPDSEGGKKRYTMIPPQVVREGTKKTLFTNIAEICKRMHRPPEHVNSFLFSELGTTGSVDGRQMLVIKGRFQPPQIENVLRSYILEYVTCKICKSPDTILTKENRLTFMQCQTCGAKRSVANIKSGFSAQTERRNKPQ